jgi:hypothetical protein
MQSADRQAIIQYVFFYCKERKSKYMTGKQIVNLIRKLKEKGLSSDEILELIEYIETHDPKEHENL